MSKQLNNKETGHFIRIDKDKDKIDINNNRVVYTKYETIIYDEIGSVKKEFKIEQKGHEFTTINLEDYLNQTVNFTDLVINELQKELFANYVIEEGVYNWIYPLKNYRLVINNTKSNEALGNPSYLTLLNKMVTEQPNRLVQKTNTIIYVNSIEEGDLSESIVPYINDWIFIERNPNSQIPFASDLETYLEPPIEYVIIGDANGSN